MAECCNINVKASILLITSEIILNIVDKKRKEGKHKVNI